MSANVGMGECCLSGVIAQGSPKGKFETIGGLNTYVSAPENGSKEKTVIFIPEVFGVDLPNIQLLADEYAKLGFYAYIPDVFKGDPIPYDFLDTVEPPLGKQQEEGIVGSTARKAKIPLTLMPWLAKHPEKTMKPIIDDFIENVKAIQGTGKVGAIGFCWGGRYAILAAHDKVDAAFAAHPSLVAVPGDFDPVKKPLSIAIGTKDSLLDLDTVGKIRECMEAKHQNPPFELKEYEDQVHGFALRGDWTSDKDKAAMDATTQQGLTWFDRHL